MRVGLQKWRRPTRVKLVVIVLCAVVLVLSVEVGISLFVWWLLTGPGGLSINPWLFGVLAFVFWSLSSGGATQSRR